MHLFVVRHAIAEDAEPGQDDSTRELTSDGVKKFKREVRTLRELDWRFSTVLTSPWKRAVQTAHLLAPVIDGETTETELMCDVPRAELFALIAATASTATDTRHATAVVGHEPWLSALVGWLAFGDTRHGEAIAIKRGGIVWLEGSPLPAGMKVRAILPPKVLRSLD